VPQAIAATATSHGTSNGTYRRRRIMPPPDPPPALFPIEPSQTPNSAIVRRGSNQISAPELEQIDGWHPRNGTSWVAAFSDDVKTKPD
jgi:hypothetical protein